jgi:cysteinyl-tRNA synthetase
MSLNLYNTLTRTKEEFIPLDPPKVRMYCCGPTVYNFAHIGNLRTYIFEDILRRTLLFNGFEIQHCMNITDVGHLESDSDEGEDKMEKGAMREGVTVWDLARKYEEAWLTDMHRLNIQRPEIVCRATDHVQDMIQLIEKILANGYGYIAPGAVYFDTSKFPQYADFARLDLSGLQAGAGGRVQILGEKKHPNDFALWFMNKPRHIMQWDSPWGRGYPGWHIECSAMSMRYLGDTFDIHCGGVDHIPVHHTNEIAQSEAASGKPFVKYWLHGEFLMVTQTPANNDPSAQPEQEETMKMSKSSENFIAVQSLLDRGYDPIAYRYLCLQAHYRSELRFSWDNLQSAQTGLRKIYSANPETDPLKNENDFQEARLQVLESLNDDLNTPQVVGLLNRFGSYRLWRLFDDVLGLDFEQRTKVSDEMLPAMVTDLIEKRNEARKEKNWTLSDQLRNQLVEMGYEVGDSPNGTTVKKRLM